MRQRVRRLGHETRRSRLPRRWPNGWHASSRAPADDPRRGAGAVRRSRRSRGASRPMIDQELARSATARRRAGARRERRRARSRARRRQRTAAPTCCRRSCAAIAAHRSPTASSSSPLRASSKSRRTRSAVVPRPDRWWSRVLSADRAFRDRFVASPHVDRLNLGAIATTQIGWDQPHEGNLFDHLYARRAIQRLA